MKRRNFLKSSALGLTAAGIASSAVFRHALACPETGPSPIFWVHVQGGGGWDQALFCDPKPSVRAALPAAEREIRMAGAIPYLSFADLGAAAGAGFFSRHHDRLTVFNGVDTGTNNHTVGQAYSASGSSVPDYPCFAAQVAAACGVEQPMPLIAFSGYDRTGGMVAPARIPQGSERVLGRLGTPRDGEEGELISASVATRVEEARLARIARLRERFRLPRQARALTALEGSRRSEGALSRLVVPPYREGRDPAEGQIELALSAFRAGLTTACTVEVTGFDTHDDSENEQRVALGGLFGLLDAIVTLSDAVSVPVVVVGTSDFGRTPHHSGSGTDHHPISSILVLQNEATRALSLSLPTDRVIGATTDGDETHALQAARIDPATLARSDTGIVLTPGHVMRALRRVAGIESAPILSTFPLTVSEDLSIG